MCTRLCVCIRACMCVCMYANACLCRHECLCVCVCAGGGNEEAQTAAQQVSATDVQGCGDPSRGNHCLQGRRGWRGGLCPPLRPPSTQQCCPFSISPWILGPGTHAPPPNLALLSCRGMAARALSPRAWVTRSPGPQPRDFREKWPQLPRPPFPHLQNGDNQSTTLTGRLCGPKTPTLSAETTQAPGQHLRTAVCAVLGLPYPATLSRSWAVSSRKPLEPATGTLLGSLQLGLGCK